MYYLINNFYLSFHMYYVIYNISSLRITLELWNLLFPPNLYWSFYDKNMDYVVLISHVLHFMFGQLPFLTELLFPWEKVH